MRRMTMLAGSYGKVFVEKSQKALPPQIRAWVEAPSGTASHMRRCRWPANSG